MTTPVFPSGAQFLTEGFEVTAGGTLHRTEMEDGIVHQSGFSTRARTQVAVVYRLPSSRARQDFEAWRRDTLRNGALWFLWPDPHDWTGATQRRARIVGGEVKYSTESTLLMQFRAAFTLEYWS